MTEFEHRKPPESSHVDKDRHEIGIIGRLGKEIGKLEFSYFSKPFPYYYLNNIQIETASRTQGHGRDAMLFFNAYLKKTGKAGVLYDSMSPWVKQKGMYERYGWKPIPGTRFLAFNIPKGRSTEQLSGIEKSMFSDRRLERLRERSTHPDRIQ